MGGTASTETLKRRIATLGGVYSNDIDAMTRQQLRDEYRTRKRQQNLYVGRTGARAKKNDIYYVGRRVLPFGRRCHNY